MPVCQTAGRWHPSWRLGRLLDRAFAALAAARNSYMLRTAWLLCSKFFITFFSKNKAARCCYEDLYKQYTRGPDRETDTGL